MLDRDRLRSGIALSLAVLLAVGCGGSGDNMASDQAKLGGTDSIVAKAPVEVPNACTFFSRAELESAVGAELKDGEPQAVPNDDESSCKFERQLGRYATKTFANPAIPSSVGLTSVTISTYASEPEIFAEGQAMSGMESVPGVGRNAYFNGPNLLHVSAGNRGFSLRINPLAQSGDDQAKVRQVMLELAKTGTSRL